MRPYSIEARAKKVFGTCDYFPHATWLLKDGTLLNGSCEGKQRDVDHAEIGDFYEKAQGAEAVKKFIRRGNVRVMCDQNAYIFQLRNHPNEEQENVLLNAYYDACDRKIPYLIYRAQKHDYGLGKLIFES